MNEPQTLLPLMASATQPPQADQETAGRLLRQAREAAGLHIAALAVALKVPVAKLEALEADDLVVLPDAVFTRALASSVCRTLKVDAAPVLALLPQTTAPLLGLRSNAGLNMPVKGMREEPGTSFGSKSPSRLLVYGVLLLLLGALVLVAWPHVKINLGSGIQQSVGVTPSADRETAPSPHGQETGAAVAPPPAVEPTTAPPAVAEAPVAPPAVTSPVSFKARSASWLKVTDASGVVVLQRTLAAGESADAIGALPLNVIVGRADATEVMVHGKAFDLAPVTRENVARFEVK
ncbi:MAG TPA: RodZ domain-containing protein [Burkholderiaceae bacterium]